jgi:hypothetical protein
MPQGNCRAIAMIGRTRVNASPRVGFVDGVSGHFPDLDTFSQFHSVHYQRQARRFDHRLVLESDFAFESSAHRENPELNGLVGAGSRHFARGERDCRRTLDHRCETQN